MKAIKKIIFIVLMFTAFSLSTQAQDNPPHPPTHENTGDSSAPLGGGAPIGGGSFVFLIMGGAYASMKWRQNRNQTA